MRHNMNSRDGGRQNGNRQVNVEQQVANRAGRYDRRGRLDNVYRNEALDSDMPDEIARHLEGVKIR